MLFEFKTKNYKSFKDEVSFSMVAAPKQSGLDYSLFNKTSNLKKIKGLCSSVVYGPNASGKTNIIGAMDVFRAIVLRSNIKNSEDKTSPNLASFSLELIPNSQLIKPEPVEFFVDFFEQGLRIQYGIQIDLGVFLDQNYKRKIVSEELTVNGELVFSRKEDLAIGKLKNVKEFLSESAKNNTDGTIKIAREGINQEELFLNNGFKLIYSSKLVKIIVDWFTNKFLVVYKADSMQLIKRFADPKKKMAYIETTTNDAAKIFGITSSDVAYIVNDDDSDAKLMSILKFQDKKVAMDAELFESYGTIRFINLFPLVVRAMQTGGTLVVDEFDASIHPMALMSIINIFHNDDINIHNAQLIFNTHNPIFLNSNLFRRDEIKFVERDEDNHFSTVYALSDFGTSGKDGVRKGEDYMKNYFISRYGAIKDIDFKPLFEKIISPEGNV